MNLPFRSLVSRLVAVGLLQLIVVAGTALAIFVLEGPHEPARPIDFLDHATRTKLEQLVDQPAALTVVLDDLERHRIDVTLYDGERQLIASNVEPPLAIPKRRHDLGPPPPPGLEDHAPGHDGPPPFGPGGPPPFDGLEAHVMVVPYHPHDQHGFLVARGRAGAPPGAIGPVLALISGFIVLVLGAVIIARWVVRPIEQLSRTARRLGDGDLTARSRLDRDDEIGELGKRFDDMADRLEGLRRSEKELLANVAHELRTPLARIGVALDLAGEGDAVAARTALGEIAVDVGELETIVDDILGTLRFEIAREAPKLPLRRALTSPAEIARAAVERLRIRHPERTLATTIAEHLPVIDVDPMLVRRVLDNLLENAHKYTPDRTLPIELRVAQVGDAIELVVKDRGIGIDPADLPRVFDAFYRSDRSRSRETGGVGLGLTLAKRIVEAHDGTIAVASTTGDGTTVTVRVPIAK